MIFKKKCKCKKKCILTSQEHFLWCCLVLKYSLLWGIQSTQSLFWMAMAWLEDSLLPTPRPAVPRPNKDIATCALPLDCDTQLNWLESGSRTVSCVFKNTFKNCFALNPEWLELPFNQFDHSFAWQERSLLWRSAWALLTLPCSQGRYLVSSSWFYLPLKISIILLRWKYKGIQQTKSTVSGGWFQNKFVLSVFWC